MFRRLTAILTAFVVLSATSYCACAGAMARADVKNAAAADDGHACCRKDAQSQRPIDSDAPAGHNDACRHCGGLTAAKPAGGTNAGVAPNGPLAIDLSATPAVLTSAVSNHSAINSGPSPAACSKPSLLNLHCALNL